MLSRKGVWGRPLFGIQRAVSPIHYFVEQKYFKFVSFLKGELYKPDSLSFGGGRGNGRDFDIEQFRVKDDEETDASATTAPAATEAPQTSAQTDDMGASFGGSSGMSASGTENGNMPQMPGNGGFPDMVGGNFSFPGGFEQQADQTGLWIQVAACAAALIAAILVIMKARNHNQ